MTHAASRRHCATRYAATCLGCAFSHALTGLRRPMDGTFDRMRSGSCSWKYKSSYKERRQKRDYSHDRFLRVIARQRRGILKGSKVTAGGAAVSTLAARPIKGRLLLLKLWHSSNLGNRID